MADSKRAYQARKRQINAINKELSKITKQLINANDTDFANITAKKQVLAQHLAELEASQAASKHHLSENEAAESENEAAESENEAAESENEAAESENETAETENEAAETENETAESENETAESEDELYLDLPPKYVDEVIEEAETKDFSEDFVRTEAQAAQIESLINEQKDEPIIPTAKVTDTENGVKVGLPSEWTANTLIKAFDKFQTIIYPFLYDLTLLSEDERSMAKAVAAKHQRIKIATEAKTVKSDVSGIEDIPFISLSVEELEAEKKVAKLEQYKQAVPLTKEEIETLFVPLEKYLQDTGITVSPIQGLLIVVSMITAQRITPILVEKGTEILGKKNGKRKK